MVGKSIRMSLANNRTQELWRSFMLEKAVLKKTVGKDLYSIQVYDGLVYFHDFSLKTEFTKWAAIEVETHDNIPIGFKPFTLKSDLYGVFLHKGPASELQKTLQFILGQWLPNSEYAIDDRPHFEILGEHYKNDDPDSEEEVWIPIKKKP